MMWGKQICDGELLVKRCTSCSLEGRGLPRWATAVLSHLPVTGSRVLEKAKLKGGLWTALRTPELVRVHHDAFRNLTREVDGVVALRAWVWSLLVRNGVPASKITISQHALPGIWQRREPVIDATITPLRIAFIGRADKVKGADTLVKAVRAAAGLNIELHLYGLTQSTTDERYWTALKSLAAGDARIAFLPPVPHHQVVPLLSGYHVLAVPSRWLETGPLVILESFAAGTPVIGSNLGGIAELVRDQDNGLLVDAEEVPAWTEALCRCAHDRNLLTRLRQGVRPPRAMTAVALEMARLYCTHLNPLEPAVETRNLSECPIKQGKLKGGESRLLDEGV
jgi:glycosyltransferase involved in cell wall biosynthesis